MNDEFQTLALLKHVPLRIAASWVEKTVTTDPPRYVAHVEYALSFRVECDEELLLALMLVDAGKGQYGKRWRSAARSELKLRLSFFPMDWRGSDAVQVNFEGLSTIVDNVDLKHAPRLLVTTRFLDGERTITSGSLLTGACIDVGRKIECRMFAVVKTDTDSKRGRWSLKPPLATGLPTGMRFLLSGETAGTF